MSLKIGSTVVVLPGAVYYNHWGTVVCHSPASNPHYPWQVSFAPGLAYWYAEEELAAWPARSES